MLTQNLSINTAVHLPSHVIYCKILGDRRTYVSCHIRVPDVDHRLPAIALDGKFYSFLKAFKDAKKALTVASRLGKREDEAAITLTSRGYVLWALEPQARFVPPAHEPKFSLRPAFGPPACLLLSNSQSYERCLLRVADLDKTIAGIRFQDSLYSVFRVETGAESTINLISKLANRGDMTLLELTQDGQYLVAIQEPTALLASS